MFFRLFVQRMLARGSMALEDKKWEDAQGFFNRALDMDAKCGEAYLGLFLVEKKCKTEHCSCSWLVQAKRQVSVMRALQSKARVIAAQCEGDEARKSVTRLSEDLSYSDPVSSPAIADAETELAACIDNLQQAVVDGSEEEILALCRKAAAALAERNRLCKLNKG